MSATAGRSAPGMPASPILRLAECRPGRSLLRGAADVAAGPLALACGLARPHCRVRGALPSAGAAAGGGGRRDGERPPCWLRNSITSARSCGLERPAKVIFVPGAKVRGQRSHGSSCPSPSVPPCALERVGKAKPPRPVATRLAHHAPQVRAERRWRRPDRHCGRRRICGTPPRRGRRRRSADKGRSAARPRPPPSPSSCDAGDRIAHRLGPLGLEELVGDERRAEQDDARAQHPSRNRVEPTVHASPETSREERCELALPLCGRRARGKPWRWLH